MAIGFFVPHACTSFTMKALAAAALGQHWSGNLVMLYEVMLWLHYSYVMAVTMVAASARREAML